MEATAKAIANGPQEKSSAITSVGHNEGGQGSNRLIELAINQNVPVETLERLLAMDERIRATNAEQQFNEALSAVQRELGRVAADANNPQTRSKYATYAALDRALRPVYTAHGFALSFDTAEGAPDNCVRVLCYLSHAAGHVRTYKIDMPADGKGAKGGDVMTKTHAAGSAMSYGMRYLLKGIFNVAIGEDDDDGNGATSAPRITEQQAADIRALLDEVGADEGRFLAFLRQRFRAQSIEDIAAPAYRDVIAAIEAKRK